MELVLKFNPAEKEITIPDIEKYLKTVAVDNEFVSFKIEPYCIKINTKNHSWSFEYDILYDIASLPNAQEIYNIVTTGIRNSNVLNEEIKNIVASRTLVYKPKTREILVCDLLFKN